ncbi:MAG: hypothetical protein J7539_17945 [Niabella sp.]|nr:hypothetical protein [Niabella sp.]
MTNWWHKKLKAGSVLGTLIIAMVILITCSVLLLALYYFKFFSIRDAIDQRLSDDLASAISLVLANDQALGDPVHSAGILFENNDADSVYYTEAQWGCFRAAGIKVAYKKRYKEKAFLYGATRYSYADASIYLADHDRPLSVTGNTYIEGKAYLPKSGIRSGFFQQKGFTRERLVEGSIDSSKKQLPALEPAFRAQLQQLAALVAGDGSAAGAGFSTARQSFLQDPKKMKLPRNARLINDTAMGNLILLSDSAIEVSATTHLEDVILIAPFIHFTSGFKGTVQAIALDSITIESGCRFEYPSALVGIGRSNTIGNTGTAITMASGTTLHGLVLGLAEKSNTNIKPVIKIQAGATVKGLVYNEGFTYLNGKVEGAVFTDFFFEQRGPMSMENILIDATVSPSKWYRQAGYFSIFTEATAPTLLKWLY